MRKLHTPDLACARRIGSATAKATWLDAGTPPTPVVRLTVTATLPGPKPDSAALADALTALTALLTDLKTRGLST